MFGKKKDKGGKAEKKPAKKSKKPKKAKSNEGISRFGDGGLKELVTNNVEKVALGIIAAAAAYVALTSWQAPGLEDSKEPENLASAVARAEQNMTAETWTQTRVSRQAEADNYKEKASADVAPVKAGDYLLSQPLEPLKNGLPKKRTDVDLLTLQDLEVRVMFAPLAVIEPMKPQTGVLLGEEDGGMGAMIDEDPNLRPIPDETARARGEGG